MGRRVTPLVAPSTRESQRAEEVLFTGVGVFGTPGDPGAFGTAETQRATEALHGSTAKTHESQRAVEVLYGETVAAAKTFESQRVIEVLYGPDDVVVPPTPSCPMGQASFPGMIAGQVTWPRTIEAQASFTGVVAADIPCY